MREITISPITRLEGHGKMSIFLDEKGDVENAYFQVPELWGFYKFCEEERLKICISIRYIAKALIRGGKVSDGLLNRVEMAFRAYDPCLACATHYAVEQMPLQINIYSHEEKLLKTLER